MILCRITMQHAAASKLFPKEGTSKSKSKCREFETVVLLFVGGCLPAKHHQGEILCRSPREATQRLDLSVVLLLTT